MSGFNPLTRPFDYLHLSGKLVLYAKRDATDQLRKIHGVSIEKLERETVEGIYVVTAYARDAQGRVDSSIGAVPIENLKGEARANSFMKAETKAKRRVTLSICGLGMLDETEVGSIPDAQPAKIDYETGEVLESAERMTETSAAIEDSADGTLNEELERSVLLAKVKACADKLKYKANVRADLWEQYVGGDPRSASIEKLNDLYAHLKGLAGVKSRVIGKGLTEKRGRILRCLDAHVRFLELDAAMQPWTPSAFGHEPRPRQTPEEWAARWERYAPPRYISPREKPELKYPAPGARGAERGGGQNVGGGRPVHPRRASRPRPSARWPISRRSRHGRRKQWTNISR